MLQNRTDGGVFETNSSCIIASLREEGDLLG